MNNSEKYLKMISIEEAGFIFTMKNADVVLKNLCADAMTTGEFEKISGKYSDGRKNRKYRTVKNYTYLYKR